MPPPTYKTSSGMNRVSSVCLDTAEVLTLVQIESFVVVAMARRRFKGMERRNIKWVARIDV